MKKTLKRVSALALTGLLGMTVLAGCNQGNKAEVDQTLEVYVINTGYRTEGVKAIMATFAEQDWVKEKYPDLEVKFTENNMTAYASNKLKAPKTNEFDIMFTSDDLSTYFEKNNKGEYPLVDLTEVVYNSELLDKPGTKYIDVVHEDFLGYFAYTTLTEKTPKYYEVPWVTGMNGLIYSEEILAKYGYTDGKTPMTTDELVELCQKIKADPANSGNAGGYAFINHSGYWGHLLYPWWAQYDGLEAYDNFWHGTLKTVRGEEYTEKIFELKGRLKALEVLYDLTCYENGFYDVVASAQGDFMQRQTMNLEGEYAMGANADWFDSEMKATREMLVEEGVTPHTFKLMKMPILSAIVETLENKEMTDAQLRQVVAAIDEGKDYAATNAIVALSEKDYNRIVEARSICRAGGTGHVAVIPSSANSQEVAIDVMKFMATKACQEAYMIATEGQNMPFDYDFNAAPQEVLDAISPLQQGRLEYFYNGNYKINVLKNTNRLPLVRYAQFTPLTTTNSNYNTIFCGNPPQSTPQALFDDTIKAWTKSKFEFAMQQAGYMDGMG